MDNLKPCPFCGGVAKLVSNTDDSYGREWHEIYCRECGASSDTRVMKDKVIESWNTRAALVHIRGEK